MVSPKAALNHVDNIKSITGNMGFDFVMAMVNIGACDAVPAVAR